MHAWLRIAKMVVVSEIILTIIAGGFNIQNMLIASLFIIVFCTLPLIFIVSIFEAMRR